MTLAGFAYAVLPARAYERLAHSRVARRLAVGSFWSVIYSIISRLVALVQGIMLARILGVDGFGEWGMLVSTTILVSTFANLGLSTTATTYVSRWRISKRLLLSQLLGLINVASLCVSVTVFGACLLFSSTIAEIAFSAPHLRHLVVFVAFVALFDSFGHVYAGIITGLERFYEVTVIAIVVNVLVAMSSVGLAYRYGVEGAVIGLVAGSAAGALLYIACGVKLLGKAEVAITFRGCSQGLRALWQTALPMSFSSVVIGPVTWLMHSLLVHQPNGYQEMGAVQAAGQWRNVVLFLPTQLSAAYIPVAASLASSGKARLRSLQWKALGVISLVALCSLLAVVVCLPFIVSLYGNGFSSYSSVFALFAIQGGLEACIGVFRNTLVATTNAWHFTLPNLLFAGVAFALGASLIPTYGSMGVASALMAAQVVQLVTLAVISSRLLAEEQR